MRAEAGDHAPIARWRWGGWRVTVEREVLSTSALRGAYDALAPRWAGIRRRHGFDRAYRGIVARCPAPPRAVVADLGCGDGGLALAWCRAHPDLARVVAVDLSPRMVARAVGALSARGVPVDGVVGDLRSLSLGDDAFDVVLVGHVLEHCADLAPALVALRRMVRPGGYVVIVHTRRTLPGWWLGMRWQLGHLGRPSIAVALRAAGWGVDPLVIDGWWPQWSSEAWVARRDDLVLGG